MDIEIWVMTDKVGSKAKQIIKFEDEDWQNMTDQEKDQVIWEEITNGGMIDFGYKVL